MRETILPAGASNGERMSRSDAVPWHTLLALAFLVLALGAVVFLGVRLAAQTTIVG